MKGIGFLLLLGVIQVQAQQVGIGTSNPSFLLHLNSDQSNAGIGLQGLNSSIDFYRNHENAAYIETRPQELALGLLGNTERFVFYNTLNNPLFTMNADGLGIGTTTPLARLHITGASNAIRIDGVNPYLTLYNGATQSGYIQGWTDGLALGSNSAEVGLWTGGLRRFAVRTNGALQINGSDGINGQVLTSGGSASAAGWVYPTNSIYNSATVKTAAGFFTAPSANTEYDIPGLSHSFTLTGNTLVQVALNTVAGAPACFGCGNSQVFISLYANGTQQFYWNPVIANGTSQSVGGVIQLKLPAGNHTLKAVINSTSGPLVALGNNANMSLLFFPQ